MKKLLPIGFTDYKEIIDNNCYYVDKTLLVKDILQSGKVVLLPRPRRFGKTLNLSMLRYFFEKGTESTAYLFEQQAIWQETDYRKLQGQFPVVFLTFKSAEFSTFEHTFAQLSRIIGKEFTRHSYLLEGSALSSSEKKYVQRIIDFKGSYIDLSSSIESLIQFLHRYHQKKVMVLIDEYDVPVQSGFIHGFYEEIIELIKSLLTSALKDNSSVERGVLSGILTLAKAGIFSGLNNLSVYTLTHERSSDRFGFTSEETEELLNYYGINNHKNIKKWYNGYIFGTTQGIFNPWSLLKCIESNCVFEAYWANTSDNILLRRLLTQATASTRSDFETLLSGGSIKKSIVESIVFPDLDKLQDLVWSLLLFTGYLTYESFERVKGRKIAQLRLPNEEIEYLFEELIKEIFSETVIGNEAEELIQSLLKGNTSYFAELLQGFVLNSMSSHDVPANEPERSYHLFVLGLLVLLGDEYDVISNRESGLGRYDILIAPKNPSQTGVIIEFKKALGQEKLKEAAQKALEQIISKNYVQELKAKNVHHILAYGIAFSGKNLEVVSQEL